MTKTSNVKRTNVSVFVCVWQITAEIWPSFGSAYQHGCFPKQRVIWQGYCRCDHILPLCVCLHSGLCVWLCQWVSSMQSHCSTPVTVTLSQAEAVSFAGLCLLGGDGHLWGLCLGHLTRKWTQSYCALCFIGDISNICFSHRANRWEFTRTTSVC